MLECWY